MPKVDPSLSLDLCKALYAYINRYRTNYSSENTPKVYYQDAPQNLDFSLPIGACVRGTPLPLLHRRRGWGVKAFRSVVGFLTDSA